MKTRVVGPKGKEVFFGDGLPTVLIGERINPFGRAASKRHSWPETRGRQRERPCRRSRPGPT